MTRANTNHKHLQWLENAGSAASIIPIARFVGSSTFALKGGGYGRLLSLQGIDEEGMTDQELESRVRGIEGSLRGLPEGSCLYQYARVMSGFHLPRQDTYSNAATEGFVRDRLAFLEEKAAFRRIGLFWCLTMEPGTANPFQRKPKEQGDENSRMLTDLEKTVTILVSNLGNTIGLKQLDKNETFQFFSYLFNLEEWAGDDQLRQDTGVDRQIVKNPVGFHNDQLRVGKRHI
jgi:type IV secretion system protein VirB4